MRHLARCKLLSAFWQLKETKIELASGELGICVGVATCRLIPGEGDRGQEKAPVGAASSSLTIFLLAVTSVLKLLIWGPVHGEWEAEGELEGSA